MTTLFVREDGSRRSITNEAHRYNFHPEQYLSRIRGAKALILGSLFRAPFDDPDLILAVVRGAKDAGQLVMADTKLPNFRKLSLADVRGALPLDRLSHAQRGRGQISDGPGGAGGDGGRAAGAGRQKR